MRDIRRWTSFVAVVGDGVTSGWANYFCSGPEIAEEIIP